MSTSHSHDDVPANAHQVGSTADLDVGESLLVEVEGIEIAIYCTDNGYYAISNHCVHQGGPLCEGPLTGTMSQDETGNLCYDQTKNVVRCPWHGWEFDIETGKHPSRSDYSQPTYDVIVKDDQLYLCW